MKKLLSLFIALAMTMAYLPASTAFAANEEGSTITIKPYESNIDELTWYDIYDNTKSATVDITNDNDEYKTSTEGKNHAPEGIYKTSHPDYAPLGFGSTYLSIMAKSPEEDATFMMDAEMVVPKSGFYQFKYAIGGPSNTYTPLSGMSVAIAPTDDADNKRIINSYVFTTHSDNKNQDKSGIRSSEYLWYVNEDDNETAWIDAGTYKVYITVYKPWNMKGDETKTDQKLTLSDITLTPAAASTVSGSQKTTLEYENYTHYGRIPNATGIENASGNKAAVNFDGRSGNNELFVNIPVYVEKGGYYSYETVVSAKGSYGNALIWVDGYQFLNSKTDTGTALNQTMVSSHLKPHKFTGKIYLSAGNHTIRTEMSYSAREDLSPFLFDYISLTPAAAESISAEGDTIELEDYIDGFAYAMGKTPEDIVTYSSGNILSAAEGNIFNYSNSNLSGGKGIAIKNLSAPEGAIVEIPIKIEQSGYYQTKARFGGSTAATNGQKKVEAHLETDTDSTFLFNTGFADNSCIDTTLTNRKSPATGAHSWVYTGEAQYITAGTYTLVLEISDWTVGSTLGLIADYISFVPVSPTEVMTEGTTTIEFEDADPMHNVNPEKLPATAYASEGRMFYTMQSTVGRNTTFRYVVDIPKTGFYDITADMSFNTGASLSVQTLSLDGKELITNTQSGQDLSKQDGSEEINYVSNELPMHRYSNCTYITKGIHEITLTVNTTNGKHIKFAADHMTIEYSDPGDIIQQENTGLLVNKSLGTPTTGTAYAAFYLGGKLMDIATQTIENESSVLFNFPGKTWLDYDRLSVLVWDDNLEPQSEDLTYISSQPLNVAPFADDEEEINVVFIGDSLYEAYGVTESHKFSTQVGQWFKAQYEDEDTKVNYYNKGVGSTTTDYSLVRLQRDVMAYEPDVVFFGTTINDGSRDTTRNMESVIRTLQAMENPPYIIMTRFPTRAFGGVPSYGKDLATHYNIPFIDATDAFKAAVESGQTMESMFKDSSHPNDAGNDVISNEIISKLETYRFFNKGTNDTPLLNESSGIVESVEIFGSYDASKVTASEGWTNGTTYMHSSTVGDTLEFTFDGNILAFTYGLHEEGLKLEVYVDDELKITCDPYYSGLTNYKRVCKGNSICLDLGDGTHNVVMKTVASDSNEATTQVMRVYDIFTASWAD